MYTNVANQGLAFQITETKIYVTAVTLSTQGKAKLLPQLKSYKLIITISLKYQLQQGMIYLDYQMAHIMYQIFKIILSIF